jgi:hypothetical protein
MTRLLDSISRAMVREVMRAPITAMTTAITPGRMATRLSRAWLNQVRSSMSRGGSWPRERA